MNTPNFEWGHSREYSKQYLDAQKLKTAPFYRITIYSKDRLSGDVRNGVYAINMPDSIQDVGKYHFALEEFVMAAEPTNGGTNGINRTYIIETSLPMMNTYSTSTQSTTKVLAQLCKSTPSSNALAYYYKPVFANAYGIPVTDVNFMRNKQISIAFKKVDDTAHDTVSIPDTANWSMTLVVYPFSP